MIGSRTAIENSLNVDEKLMAYPIGFFISSLRCSHISSPLYGDGNSTVCKLGR
jgi:hypothetical protein